jgi:hypothetical protein
MRRSISALAAVIAVVAIFVGIKDYIEQQKEKPAASTSTRMVVASKTITVPKNTTSAKTGRSRMSANKAVAPATAQAGADNMEKPLISEEFAKASAEPGADNNTIRAQTAHDKVEAATLSTAQCLPLPNGTKPGNVDEGYYKNWAREYLCLIP